MAEPYERECGARPGLEARLCLSLIDFQRNCSQPPSSLMKPSGICQPSTLPAPRRSSLPPSSTSPPPPATPSAPEHTRAQSRRPYTCAAAATEHGACCSGFCLVAFLLYPQTKKEKLSQESKNPSCLCL